MRRRALLPVAALLVTSAATNAGAFKLENSVFLQKFTAEPKLKELMPCLIKGFQADEDIMFMAEFAQVEILSNKDKIAFVGTMLEKHQLKTTNEARAILLRANVKIGQVAVVCVNLYD